MKKDSKIELKKDDKMKKNTKNEIKNNDKMETALKKSLKKKTKQSAVPVKKITKQEVKKGLEQNLVTEKKTELKLVTGTLTERDLAKIEKKKAKKLAQKLKKRQTKLATAEATPPSVTPSKPTKDKKIKKDNVAKIGEDTPSATPSKPTKEKKIKKENVAKIGEDTKGSTKSEKTKNDKKQNVPAKQIKTTKPKRNENVKKERDPTLEASTVFVGNLPINTKRVQLVRLFKDYGTIKSIRLRTAGGKAIFKHKTRKAAPALNAFCILDSADAATNALALNGFKFKENHLRVTRSDKNAYNRLDADAKTMIFVGNLKYTATEDKLREIFSSCGEIEYVRCLQEGEKGCKGVAYVCFKTPDAVGLALELNETILDERPIHVERYSVKKLGAKEARDAANVAPTKKLVTGAKKRLDQKKGGNDKKQLQTKKTEYRGVKVDVIKKKQKKKKVSGQMQLLAKKIAPKTL